MAKILRGIDKLETTAGTVVDLDSAFSAPSESKIAEGSCYMNTSSGMPSDYWNNDYYQHLGIGSSFYGALTSKTHCNIIFKLFEANGNETSLRINNLEVNMTNISQSQTGDVGDGDIISRSGSYQSYSFPRDLSKIGTGWWKCDPISCAANGTQWLVEKDQSGLLTEAFMSPESGMGLCLNDYDNLAVSSSGYGATGGTDNYQYNSSEALKMRVRSLDGMPTGFLLVDKSDGGGSATFSDWVSKGKGYNYYVWNNWFSIHGVHCVGSAWTGSSGVADYIVNKNATQNDLFTNWEIWYL